LHLTNESTMLKGVALRLKTLWSGLAS